MSNKHEIEEELNQAQARLDALCQNEGTVDDHSGQTVTVQPTVKRCNHCVRSAVTCRSSSRQWKHLKINKKAFGFEVQMLFLKVGKKIRSFKDAFPCLFS